MKYQEAVKKFLDYIDVERNLSPNTQHAYSYELCWFGDYLADNPPIEGIGTERLREHMAGLQKRGYGPASIGRAISTLKSFFQFLEDSDYILKSPARKLRTPRLARKIPVFLSSDELARLLAAPEKPRDRAIMTMLPYCGLRVSELVSIELHKLDVQARVLTVYGKGAKERMIPLAEIALEAISAHLACRRPPGPYLFTNRLGGQLSTRWVEYMVNQYAARAGIKKISPHKLRHTFGTMLYHNDVGLREIQSLMGHATIASTELYTHTSPERLRSAIDTLR